MGWIAGILPPAGGGWERGIGTNLVPQYMGGPVPTLCGTRHTVVLL